MSELIASFILSVLLFCATHLCSINNKLDDLEEHLCGIKIWLNRSNKSMPSEPDDNDWPEPDLNH